MDRLDKEIVYSPTPNGTIILQLDQFVSCARIPEGAINSKLELSQAVGGLDLTFSCLFLTEPAGKVERSEEIVDCTNFPRWLPKWLQRRWTKTRKVTLSVTPKYSYPSSSIKVKGFGPVRLFTTTSFGEED